MASHPTNNGIDGLMEMSIWMLLVGDFLLYWLIVLWIDTDLSWKGHLASTFLVLGLCYLYYQNPSLLWIWLMLAFLLGLQVFLFSKSYRSANNTH